MADVLIVEDNETLREGMGQVVERMDHSSLMAAGGAEGLEMYEEHGPELVITDLKMDDVDGMEVLRRVVEADEEAIVMIVTAFGSIEKAVEAMKAGAFDFIPKPFPPELLREKIEKAFGVLEARRE
ncbi:MAG: response regulator, partial [Bradymonadaceae bacterium]